MAGQATEVDAVTETDAGTAAGAAAGAVTGATVDPTARTGQQTDHDVARAQILDAAAAVFQKLGFDRTTIDDIADRIGATKGRVYYYFRSKFDIYLTIYEEGMQRATQSVRPLASSPGSGRERLTVMSVRHLVNLMTDLGYHDVISQGVVAGRSTALKERQREALAALNEIRQQYEYLFRDVVAEGMADGSLRSGDPRLATRFLLSSLNSTAMWYVQRPDQGPAEITALAERLVDQAIGGLGA